MENIRRGLLRDLGVKPRMPARGGYLVSLVLADLLNARAAAGRGLADNIPVT